MPAEQTLGNEGGGSAYNRHDSGGPQAKEPL